MTMDKEEARALLASYLASYRTESHQRLQRLLESPEGQLVVGTSGAQYYVAVEAVWDDTSGGDLRVIGSIESKGLLSSLSPLCDDFILSPNGHFVGE